MVSVFVSDEASVEAFPVGDSPDKLPDGKPGIEQEGAASRPKHVGVAGASCANDL